MTYDSDYEEEEGIELDLEMLREDLVGELQAINQYQEHIDTMGDEEAIAHEATTSNEYCSLSCCDSVGQRLARYS